VDLAAVQLAWNDLSFLDNNDDTTKAKAAVALLNHCILPQAGRDIVNASTLLSRNTVDAHPNSQYRIPTSHAAGTLTNCLCSIPGGRVAAALADGMVVILDAKLGSDERLLWGVSDPLQIALSYPSIGIETVELMDETVEDHEKRVSYVACCLRGSSTYLIPIDDDDEGDVAAADDDAVSASPRRRPLLCFSLPHDMDQNVPVRYIQNFAAGCFTPKFPSQSNDDETTHHEIPIVAYALPSGVITVYACGLLPSIDRRRRRPTDPTLELLKALVECGAAERLRLLLLLLLHPPKQVETKSGDGSSLLWDDARNAIRENYSDSIPFSVHDVCFAPSLAAFRTLLLHLAAAPEG